MFLRKLVISNLTTRRTRVALTIAAVALSVSLVVSVTSGYASVVAALNKYIDRYVGTIDAQISRVNDPRGGLKATIVDGLRADPDVKRVEGRVEVTAPLLATDGKPLDGRMVSVIGVDRPTDTRIDNLRLHAGEFFNVNDAPVIVIDQALAEQEKLNVGDTIGLAGTRKVMLKIIGVVHKPEVMAAHMQTAYVPLKVLQRYQGWDGSTADGVLVNRITIELNREAKPREFETRWKEKLATLEPAAKLRLVRDVREEMNRNMIAVELMSYLGGAVSMLAAMFIVFSALSMGVSERQRTLAMMRAIGATRWQVASLVVVEGLLLGGGGALVGAPLGWLWIKILSLIFDDIFSAGVVINGAGLALGIGGSVVAALAASLLPAWQATRVSPLEAMAPLATAPAARTPLVAAIVGALLVSIDPFLFFGPVDSMVAWFKPDDLPSMSLNVKLVLHFLVGLPGIMLGFFLLAPVLIKAVEAVISPVVAMMLRLRPSLVRQQLSTGLWRAAGTAAALMVGLAVLVVMQVQGNSALKGWRLPTKFPDIFIVSPPGSSLANLFGAKTPPAGVDIEQVKILEEVPGIRDKQVMPIAIASPQFGHGAGAFLLTATNPEATMFFGIDPSKAFTMMELEFREGNDGDARRYLEAGEAVWLKKDQTLVPMSELAATGPDGKPKTLKGVTAAGGQYAVQGMVTKTATGYEVDAPGRGKVVIPEAAVDRVEHGRFLIVTNEFKELKGIGVGDVFSLRRADGKPVQYTVIGVVWSPGIDVIVSVFDMGRQFDQRTANSVFGSVRDAKEDFGVERIYLFAANLQWGVPRDLLVKEINKKLRTEGMKAGDVREIKEKITQAFDRLLLLASTVAFAALAVASLGVTNTVMAGIRTRRWQFGVLRSIGVTRGQLLRLVLAEAILLGVVATILGLTAGSIMVLDAHALQVLVIGYDPPIAVPWGIVSLGIGVVMTIALAASLWPALSVARASPLALLQAGRAAA